MIKHHFLKIGYSLLPSFLTKLNTDNQRAIDDGIVFCLRHIGRPDARSKDDVKPDMHLWFVYRYTSTDTHAFPPFPWDLLINDTYSATLLIEHPN